VNPRVPIGPLRGRDLYSVFWKKRLYFETAARQNTKVRCVQSIASQVHHAGTPLSSSSIDFHFALPRPRPREFLWAAHAQLVLI
jgi:hypothetical protein